MVTRDTAGREGIYEAGSDGQGIVAYNGVVDEGDWERRLTAKAVPAAEYLRVKRKKKKHWKDFHFRQ